jgi:integrase
VGGVAAETVGTSSRESCVSDAAGGPRLGPYLDEWLERQATQLRPTTLRSYRQVITAYLKPTLGDRALAELDRRELELLYARLLREGGRRGGPLSVRSVAYVHAVLRRALSHAVLDGLLSTNPAASLRPPRHRPDVEELAEERELWAAADAARFLAFVDDHPWRALWHLAVGTGARRGELLGLRWREVDLDAGHITISRGLSFVEGVPRLLGTKTSRRRVVSIGASVIDALRRHEEQQRAKREAATDWQDRWGLVFTQADGAPIDPLAVTKEFRALVRQAPVPVIRMHDIRHAHASILLGAGVPVPVVSRRLGHATVSMTLDVYSHVLPGMDAEAAAKIETALRHDDGSGPRQGPSS